MAEEHRPRIRESVFRGWHSIEMESEEIILTMIPELGGKIVSLFYKPSMKQWLIDSGVRELEQAAYGSEFIAADMSGWDECFPSIVACPYPLEGAYKGRWIPDHGEIWAVPWQVEWDNGSLLGKVKGRQLPYEFGRSIYFCDDRTLRLEYNVINTSSEPLSVLWSAHPQFITTAHTRIRLPGNIAKLLCVDGGRSLVTGSFYDWPHGDGSLLHQLDSVGPASAEDCRKFYVEGQVKEGWAELYERDSGVYIKLEWNPEMVPYLGIWMDEGLFNDKAVCAIEPCNGYYDSLSEACSRGKVMLIDPNDRKTWYLEVQLGSRIIRPKKSRIP